MDEDMILPEDFVEDIPTETDESVNNDVEIEENSIETETNEEIQPQVEENQSEEGSVTPNEPFLKVKYNKEEVELTQDQVIELSQKGMNYDKLQQRYQEAVNNPNLMYLNELAERNGMQVDELVGYWRQQEEQRQIDELVQKNIPEEYAREMLESRKFREQQQQMIKEKEEEAEREADWKRQQDEFVDAYPDVNPADIPQAVWDKWRGGVPLKYAYMEAELSNLREKNTTLETNLKNKGRTVLNGGISTHGSDSGVSEDAFLDGFNSI